MRGRFPAPVPLLPAAGSDSPAKPDSEKQQRQKGELPGPRPQAPTICYYIPKPPLLQEFCAPGGIFCKMLIFRLFMRIFSFFPWKSAKNLRGKFFANYCAIFTNSVFSEENPANPAVRALFFSLRACNYSSAPFFISRKCRIMKGQHNRKELALWAKIKLNSLSAAPPAA